MRLKIFIIVLIVFICDGLKAQAIIIKPDKVFQTSVAIIADSITFDKVKEEIIGYKKSIEDDKLSAYVLIDNWKNPDEIKKHILKLYNSKPELEGVIFVGDIPIPMIRVAQHLTSAFKIDEYNYAWNRSSIPSDRFYDDFDLKFDYLGKDSLNQLYHYYRLRGDSPQRIQKEIYSARIKAIPDDSLKYERLKNFLKKVIEVKKKPNKLDNVLVYTGHGYNSESLTSLMDEIPILQESLPDAFSAGGRFKKYFYQMDKKIKSIILEELENQELDLTIFHAHGDPVTQLISGTQPAKSIDDNIKAIKYYLRSKLRSAKERSKSIEETKEYFKQFLGVPDGWFEGAFDEKIMIEDSIFASDMEISIEDIKRINPQSEVIIFDECFNGSFHLSEYLAGAYLFNEGETIAGIANSVNVLQDLFIDELIGLLSLNWRVGQWHLLNSYLESHILGDPTFRFHSNIDHLDFYSFKSNSDKNFWRKKLVDKNPSIRTLACLRLSQIEGEKFSNELTKIYETDSSPNVRLMTLKILASFRNEDFEKVLFKSINDPNELIRRFTVLLMGYTADNKYLPLIVEAAFNDESDRVRYNARSVIELNNRPDQIEIIQKLISEKINIKRRYGFDSSMFFIRPPDQSRQNEILQSIKLDKTSLKKKINELKTFRRYIYSSVIDDLINLLNDEINLELKITAVECLGWNYYNKDRFKIISALKQIAQKETDPKLIDEINKTINRLIEGPNNPFTP